LKSLYYDARSEKHQITPQCLCSTTGFLMMDFHGPKYSKELLRN